MSKTKQEEELPLCIKEQHLGLISLLRSQLYSIEKLMEDQRKHLLSVQYNSDARAALAINEGIAAMLKRGEVLP